MKHSSYTFVDEDDTQFKAEVLELHKGRYLELTIRDSANSSSAEIVWIPADKVEEVVLAIAKVAAPLVTASDASDTIPAAGD